MVKYRNPNKELEMLEAEEVEKQEELLKEPAKNVEEEVWKKRYGDQQRYLNQVKSDMKVQIDELNKKLEQALRGQIKAPKSDDDIDAWRAQYPEFDAILETILQKRIHEATASTNKKLEEIENERTKLEADKAVEKLRSLHPDFDELAKSEAFHVWLKEQDESAQHAIYRGFNVKAADLVIKAYKADNKILKKSKVDEDEGFSGRDAAKVVRVPRAVETPVEDFGDYEFTESQIESMSKKNRKWFNDNEEKIMSAMRRGKVFMDITGGAR